MYGGKKDFKQSLKTRSKIEAKEKAAILHAQYVLEFQTKRQELNASKHRKKPTFNPTTPPQDLVATINANNPSFRKLSCVKDRELETIVVKEFLTLESGSNFIRNQTFLDDYGNLDNNAKQEAIYNLQVDHMACTPNSPYFVENEWEEEAISTLATHKIALNSKPYQLPNPERSKFEKFSNHLRQAHAESLWRTITTLEEGQTFAENNPFFASSRIQNYDVARTSSETVTLEDCFEKFEASRVRMNIREKGLKQYKRVFRIISDVFGAQTPVSSVTIGDIEAFVGLIEKLPKGFQTESKTSFKEYIIRSKQKVVSSKTQRDLYDDVRAIFAFAERRHYIQSTPCLKDLRPLVLSEEKQKRYPLTKEELTGFFTFEIFKEKVTKYPAKYWVTLLSLFHGLRVNEASSLYTADIKEEDGLHYINIEANLTEDLELRKQLKNQASMRRVPLHSKMIELGFLDFVAESKTKRLFPKLGFDKDGNKGQTVSKWFNYNIKAFLNDEALSEGGPVFHSLRHNFATELRRNHVPDTVIQELGGWGENGKSFSDRDYGEYPLSVLAEHLNKIDYSFMDF